MFRPEQRRVRIDTEYHFVARQLGNGLVRFLENNANQDPEFTSPEDLAYKTRNGLHALEINKRCLWAATEEWRNSINMRLLPMVSLMIAEGGHNAQLWDIFAPAAVRTNSYLYRGIMTDPTEPALLRILHLSGVTAEHEDVICQLTEVGETDFAVHSIASMEEMIKLRNRLAERFGIILTS